MTHDEGKQRTPQIGRDAGIYVVGAGISRVITLLVTPLTIALLTPADYGFLAVVFALRMGGERLATLGVGGGLGRFVMDPRQRAERADWVASAMAVGCVGVLVIGGLCLALQEPIARLFSIGTDVPLGALLVTGIAGVAAYAMVGRLLVYTERSELFAGFQIAEATIRSGAVAVGLLVFDLGGEGIAWIVAGTTGGIGLVGLFVLREVWQGGRASVTRVQRLLRQSIPLLGGDLASLGARIVDRAMVAALLGLSAAGVYAVGAALAQFGGQVLAAVTRAWHPHILAIWREPGAPERLATFFAAFVALTAVGAIAAGLWGAAVISLFRPDGAYASVGGLVPFLVVAIGLIHAARCFAIGPEVLGQTHWVLGYSVAALAVTVVGNLLLIPQMGVTGAAVSTAAGAAVAAVIAFAASHRLYPTPARWRWGIAISIACAVFAAWSDSALMPGTTAQGFGTRAAVTLVLSVGLLGSFAPELRRLLKRGASPV